MKSVGDGAGRGVCSVGFMLMVEIRHQARLALDLELVAIPAADELQSGLRADEVVCGFFVAAFAVAGPVVGAGEVEMLGEVEIAGAQEPVHGPVGVVGVQAEPPADFHVFDLARIRVAEEIVQPADAEVGDLQPRRPGEDRFVHRIAVDLPADRPLLQAPIGCVDRFGRCRVGG